MKKVFRQFFLALSLLSLFGCGLKGPLYFPPEPQSAAPTAQQQDTDRAQQPSSAQQ
ncbi:MULTISPECIES: LPS translocon maturation chaperone LptM [unclassified Brenneria]|uniref:LPS translocon maturation chaperone LptM n=1 Tax=unclassified Brenneria TaxID=2634434 RepID=UPI001C130561|nr:MULTISPECIES: lipoprotein [unclassified Brenneria]MEE3644297.1 lipoprotein [Brenneria sp. L3_3C_1]MEE3652522.1 lipoprotein [Brenneria sp. HEZEL_4_2_4]